MKTTFLCVALLLVADAANAAGLRGHVRNLSTATATTCHAINVADPGAKHWSGGKETGGIVQESRWMTNQSYKDAVCQKGNDCAGMVKSFPKFCAMDSAPSPAPTPGTAATKKGCVPCMCMKNTGGYSGTYSQCGKTQANFGPFSCYADYTFKAHGSCTPGEPILWTPEPAQSACEDKCGLGTKWVSEYDGVGKCVTEYSPAGPHPTDGRCASEEWGVLGSIREQEADEIAFIEGQCQVKANAQKAAHTKTCNAQFLNAEAAGCAGVPESAKISEAAAETLGPSVRRLGADATAAKATTAPAANLGYYVEAKIDRSAARTCSGYCASGSNPFVPKGSGCLVTNIQGMDQPISCELTLLRAATCTCKVSPSVAHPTVAAWTKQGMNPRKILPPTPAPAPLLKCCGDGAVWDANTATCRSKYLGYNYCQAPIDEMRSGLKGQWLLEKADIKAVCDENLNTQKLKLEAACAAKINAYQQALYCPKQASHPSILETLYNDAKCPVIKAVAKKLVTKVVGKLSDKVCVDTASEAALECQAAGGGPEDPFADTCSVVTASAFVKACKAVAWVGGQAAGTLTADAVAKQAGCN